MEGDDAEDEEEAQKQQPAERRAGMADGGRAAEGGERRVGTVLSGRAAAGVAHAVAAGDMALGWVGRIGGLGVGHSGQRAGSLEGTRFRRRTAA